MKSYFLAIGDDEKQNRFLIAQTIIRKISVEGF